MPGSIYLIQDDGQLVEMQEKPYDSEDLLQGLLAKYPGLLAGDQIDDAAPRRWLLISREVALPSEADGVGRWSVDHLFLDQDAVPTLVEVKRSSDTRIRREVVGQMLDYAANAVLYWPVEVIRAQFEANCEVQDRDPDQVLGESLGAEIDPEEFWQKAKTNLQAGRIRLVFVADEIPAELQRIVEFLYKQMDPAKVFAVEIKQYVGQRLKTLVPRVIGQTAGKPPQPPTKQWDETSFFQDLEARQGADEARVARRIFEWARSKTTQIAWGKGSKVGTFTPMLDPKGIAPSLIGVGVWTNGYVTIAFSYMQNRPPFNDEAKRLELLKRLNAVPGVNIPVEAITKFPNIRLSTLKDATALQQFLEVLDWVVQEIKAS